TGCRLCVACALYRSDTWLDPLGVCAGEGRPVATLGGVGDRLSRHPSVEPYRSNAGQKREYFPGGIPSPAAGLPECLAIEGGAEVLCQRANNAHTGRVAAAALSGRRVLHGGGIDC